MKSEIHTVQELMNNKLGQLERKNKHQVRRYTYGYRGVALDLRAAH